MKVFIKKTFELYLYPSFEAPTQEEKSQEFSYRPVGLGEELI